MFKEKSITIGLLCSLISFFSHMLQHIFYLLSNNFIEMVYILVQLISSNRSFALMLNDVALSSDINGIAIFGER